MDTLEDRIKRLEAQLAATSAAPPAAPPSKPLWSRWLAWMGGEAPKLLASVVVLVLGFWIKDSVDLAIKQRQLDLSYSKEMQGLVQKLAEQTELGQLQDTAVVLASFGEPALSPLLAAMRSSGVRAIAAEQGLEMLALRDATALCATLPRVLQLRSRRFDWQAHLMVVRLLGSSGCTKAATVLRDYRELVRAAQAGDDKRFAALVSALPAAPAEDYARLIKGIDQALANLQ